MAVFKNRALKLSTLLFILFSCSLLSSEDLDPPQEKSLTHPPNILIILVDDLGYGDLGCYGAKDLKTPAVDSLAARGMRFLNAYANCPVCSPTRAALLTGRYPDMVGVPGVIRTHRRNSWGNLIEDCIMLPQVLKRAGYHTAIIGKWHLGLLPPDTPLDRGFDHFEGFLGDMMDDYYTHRRHGFNYMRRNRKVIDPKGHATDLFTQWACNYLKSRKKTKPFFLYLCYNAPHAPIQPPPQFLKKVKERLPGISPKRAKLVALIEHLDTGIGKVIRTLEETGLAKRTLVIFTSDNGGQIGAGANNGPYRAGKGTVYEGGIRVPLIAFWPGRIPPATVSKKIVLTMDIFPTVIEAASLKCPKVDGESFLPTLLGQKQPERLRYLFWRRREGGSFFRGKTIEAVRYGPWKLLRSRPGGPYELYNLKEDPYEKKYLSKVRPDVVEKLGKVLERQCKIFEKVPWRPPKEGYL